MTDSLADIDTLLDQTMQALADGQQPTPQVGTDTLDQWIGLLTGVSNADELLAAMRAVQTRLRQPTPTKLADPLTELAAQTQLMSSNLGAEGDMAPRLEALSGALRGFANKF